MLAKRQLNLKIDCAPLSDFIFFCCLVFSMSIINKIFKFNAKFHKNLMKITETKTKKILLKNTPMSVLGFSP